MAGIRDATIFALPITKRSVGQGVKTPPFHGGITGSIPVRSTSETQSGTGFHSSDKISRALVREFRNSANLCYLLFFMHGHDRSKSQGLL